MRSSGHRRWGTLLCLSLSCVTASAAFVAVEFGGSISNSDFGHRTGAAVTGYFTYQSGEPEGPQSDSRPNFVFEIPESQFRVERSSYGFAIHNNLLPGDTPGDGLALQFSYPDGFAALSLSSSNTSLFANDLTPPTIPALEQFDGNTIIYVTVEHPPPYRTMVVHIDQLSVVPGSGLGRPVIFSVQRTAGALRFRFLTESSTGYTVEFTSTLAKQNWLTLTNVGIRSPATEPIAIINDEPRSGQWFYRIRKE